MRIRFGYVAMALNIQDGSPNKTTTFTNLMKIPVPEDRIQRLRRLVRENINSQMRVLKYNKAHDIHVFRFTSNLIPLATHPEIDRWDYIEEFADDFAAIGEYVKLHNMRVSAHPDHFTLLNSPDSKTLSASLAELEYHEKIFSAMGFGPEAKLVIHVGGVYKDKKIAVERFQSTFRELPEAIRQRIMIENDDRSYTAAEVLPLCQQLQVPMVLDVHHHACLHNNEELASLWPAIAATWGDGIPKIHLSSPKDGKSSRAHADYINPAHLNDFLLVAKKLNRDFDIMIEAKQKDIALRELMKEMEQDRRFTVVDQSTIEW